MLWSILQNCAQEPLKERVCIQFKLSDLPCTSYSSDSYLEYSAYYAPANLIEMLQQINASIQRVDERLDHMDQRFDELDRRFDEMDQRFDEIAAITRNNQIISINARDDQQVLPLQKTVSTSTSDLYRLTTALPTPAIRSWT